MYFYVTHAVISVGNTPQSQTFFFSFSVFRNATSDLLIDVHGVASVFLHAPKHLAHIWTC